jgi:hypothetical protein
MSDAKNDERRPGGGGAEDEAGAERAASCPNDTARAPSLQSPHRRRPASALRRARAELLAKWVAALQDDATLARPTSILRGGRGGWTKGDFDRAVEDLVDAGRLEVRVDSRGIVLRLVGLRPTVPGDRP